MRKVAKLGVPVAAGKLFTAASGLVTLAMLARHLGPGLFGVIAMFRTVAMMVDLFANCNTWQAIIKFGADATAAGNSDAVKAIIKLAFVIDVTTAVIGSLVVVGLAFLIPGEFGWTPHESMLCTLYALTLVSKVSGTSDGIFRICDAYRVQAIVASVAAVVATALVAIAVATGATFGYCVIALVAGEVIGNVAATVSAMWVARQAGYRGWWRVSLRGIRATFPGITRFLVTTNAQLTVRTGQSELDMIVVGSMLGKAAAGLFRVVKQLGTIPGRVFMPFEMVLFTELARCAAEHDYRGFGRLLRRSVSIAAVGSLALWIIAAIAAGPLVELVAGSAFAAAAPAFRWYLLAMILQVAGMPIMRALIALGRPGTLFLFDCGSFVVLIAAAIAGAYGWGLLGVAGAIVLHKAIQLTWSSIAVWTILRRNIEAAER